MYKKSIYKNLQYIQVMKCQDIGQSTSPGRSALNSQDVPGLSYLSFLYKVFILFFSSEQMGYERHAGDSRLDLHVSIIVLKMIEVK